MAETAKAASLPERYRRQPEADRRVKDMRLGEYGLISPSAIAIDANWGVWINPEAVVAPWSQATRGQIEIRLYDDGYGVNFARLNLPAQAPKNSPATTSFAGSGFIPAAAVT